MDEADYKTTLDALHHSLRVAQIAMFRQKRRAIVVLEGFDAAGKGGVIRELSYAWDPRGFEVFPIGPPREPEQHQPFLWRFWQKLPEPGQIAVFDRSWYGRLLVERVEGGLSQMMFERSAARILDFEAQLLEEDFDLIKVFMHIDQATQRQRLRRRADVPEKRWKLTESDLDALALHDAYEQAVADMIQVCDHPRWHVVDCNDKRSGRLAVLKAIHGMLVEKASERTFSFNPGVEARLSELQDPDYLPQEG